MAKNIDTAALAKAVRSDPTGAAMRLADQQNKLDKQKAEKREMAKRATLELGSWGGWALGTGAVGAAEGLLLARAIQAGTPVEEAGRFRGVPYTLALGLGLAAVGVGVNLKKETGLGNALTEGGKSMVTYHGARFTAQKVMEAYLAEAAPAGDYLPY